MAVLLTFEVLMAADKFKIALPPNASKSALLESYTDEIEKRVRNLVPTSGSYEVKRQDSTASNRVWVRHGPLSGFSVIIRSTSASSAEVLVRGSSKLEGQIVDFIAIPGLVCSFATFLVLWLGLLGRGVFFIGRGFRIAGVAAFLVLVAFLVLTFVLKAVVMAIVHLFRENEFDRDRLHFIANNLKALPVPTSAAAAATPAGNP